MVGIAFRKVFCGERYWDDGGSNAVRNTVVLSKVSKQFCENKRRGPVALNKPDARGQICQETEKDLNAAGMGLKTLRYQQLEASRRPVWSSEFAGRSASRSVAKKKVRSPDGWKVDVQNGVPDVGQGLLHTWFNEYCWRMWFQRFNTEDMKCGVGWDLFRVICRRHVMEFGRSEGWLFPGLTKEPPDG